MSYDLALSEHGDLIISGHRDLLGRSGIDLLEQRMTTRLKIQRGSWSLDRNLGSNLHRLIGMSAVAAQQSAPALVREALRGMDEIMVDDVRVQNATRDLTLIILYRVQDVNRGTLSSNEERSLTISLPVAASGPGEGE